MTLQRPVLLATVLAVLGIAAPAAQAGPWNVRSLDAGEAFVRGLDARPDRVPVLLDEAVRGRDHRLELRVGRKAAQTLDQGTHSYSDVAVDHDDHGALTVAWSRVPDSGGARHAFVWTAATGTVELATGRRSVTGLSLDVAGDGGAVLSVWQIGGTLSAARRVPGEGRFGAPIALAANVDLFPAAVAGPGGRAVVAWTSDGAAHAVAADGTASFGADRTVALPAAPGGGAPSAEGVTATATPSGRAVIAVSTARDPHGNPRTEGQRVDTFDWAPGADEPGPAVTLSHAAFASSPALVARGEIVFVAWTESSSTSVPPHTMRVARFGPDGSAPTTTYTTGARNLGLVFGRPVLQALPGTAVRAYYEPSKSGRWYTVTFDENGAPSGASSVGAAGGGADLHGALTRSGSMAVWTAKLGSTNSTYRVRIATP